MTNAAAANELAERAVRAVDPEAQLPPDWAAHAPEHYRVRVLGGAWLVLALVEQGSYVATLVRDGAATSLLITDKTVERAKALRDAGAQMVASHGAAQRDLTDNGRSANAEVATPSTDPGPELSLLGAVPRAGSSRPRDPNAPPDFEYEQSRVPRGPSFPQQPERGTGPSIGERDLHPLGRHPPLQPGLPAGGFPSGGGMHPEPFGSGQPPSFRWDPPGPDEEGPPELRGGPGGPFGPGGRGGLGGPGFGGPGDPGNFGRGGFGGFGGFGGGGGFV